MQEPGLREKFIAYLPIKKFDEEEITEKDRENTKEVCKSLKIFDETRAQTAPAFRVRTIRGKNDKNINDAPDEAYLEQQKIIENLEEENKNLKEKLEKFNSLERDHKILLKRCGELESENILLKKRLEIITKSGTIPEPMLEPEPKKIIEPEEIKDQIKEKVAEISDDEEFLDEEDEGLKKAFKENRAKMAALRKEIRQFIVQQGSPGMVALKSSGKRKKQLKNGAYDYSEEIP